MNQKILLNKTLVIGILFILIGASVISASAITYKIATDRLIESPLLNSASNTKGNILIYATWSPYAHDGYSKNSYTDLKGILLDYGYSVTLTDRSETPIITESLLSDYTELWISNSEYDWQGFFTSPEIAAIINFRDMGFGLVLNADNTDPPGGGFAHTVNQVAILLGVTFYGLANHGETPITPDFDDHPLFDGVTSIEGNINEAYMLISTPSVSVATYQGDDIIAVRDDGKGRVVFDNTIDRLRNGETNVLIADNPQYIRNIADWIGNDPPNTPEKPSGRTTGRIGVEYTYKTSAVDPDGDQVYYKWDWGDGSFSDWLGPVNSGEEASASHAWSEGSYNIKVKARDDLELESEWSQSLAVSIPRTRAIYYAYWLRFFDMFPILQRILSCIF
jgi:hypothetical protein